MSGVVWLALVVAALPAVVGHGPARLGGGGDRVAAVSWPHGAPGGGWAVKPWVAHGAGHAASDEAPAARAATVCGRELVSPPGGASAPAPRRTWITHTVLAGETLEMIAARYGTTVAALRLANRPKDRARGQARAKGHVGAAAAARALPNRLRPGRKLRVHARRVPAPRRRVEHTVEEGDTWVALSVRYHVRYRELRAWNWRVRTLRPGRTLTVWVDPDRPRTVLPNPPHPGAGGGSGGVSPGSFERPGAAALDAPPPLPELHVPSGARSRGRPQRGWLEAGVRLPDCGGPEAPGCPLYTLKVPHYDWGSSYAVGAFLQAVAHFRHDSGFAGPLCVGSMSRRHGGPFPPHASHRSGRDVDIFLPLLPWVPFTWDPNPFEVDWAATWALLRALDATGAVEMIFLDIRVQPFLYEAGRQLGATPAELGRLIQFPRPVQNDGGALVRHGRDHTRHIHVRFRCAPDEDRCYSRWGDERFLAIQRADKAAEAARKAAHKPKRGQPGG